MKHYIFASAKECAKAASMIFSSELYQNPRLVMGLATGSTPLLLYKELIKACQSGLDFSRVRTFNLDEYYGISPEHPQSYRKFMNDHLFTKLNIDLKNTRVPDGLARDVPVHCAAYEAAMKAAGGIDIQVLGIGSRAAIAAEHDFIALSQGHCHGFGNIYKVGGLVFKKKFA